MNKQYTYFIGSIDWKRKWPNSASRQRLIRTKRPIRYNTTGKHPDYSCNYA
ncbi:hypothetical protein AB6A23_14310 [Paenibacillus tarimensis]